MGELHALTETGQNKFGNVICQTRPALDDEGNFTGTVTVSYTHLLPLDAIIGMYQAINPNVNGLLNCLLVFNLPFTFFKGMLDAVICFAIYKPLSPILHGRNSGGKSVTA